MSASEPEALAAMSVPEQQNAAVSRDVFLSAMRQAASLVSVVTTGTGDRRMAITISSFASISADPPLVSVCINQRSRMCSALSENRRFAVHILSGDQVHVAETFAGRPSSGIAYDFACIDWVDRGDDREAFMSGVSIALDCVVSHVVDAGSHRIFIASVIDVDVGVKPPLIYWDRTYTIPSPASGA